MERLRQTRPYLLLTLLGLPLITPLLRATAVPCTHDGHLHYHRIVAMLHAWQNGLPFTRWLPDLAFGYGYPFFIYREAPPLYLPFFLHLAGLPMSAASNLFYALTILACGWFMFLWVRDILGERAALVSAVAYMAAPYVLIDALVRGNSPESLALPLLPLLLWSGRRWLLQPTAVSFLISTFGLAFLSLSHNISTFIFAPTLLVYLLALGWQQRLGWRAVLGRVFLLFGLGLGMTIFYTGGALLELEEVTLRQSTAARGNNFRFNFASLSEIFAPVPAEDPLLLNPPLPLRLGWAPVALAIFGIVRLVWWQFRAKTTQSRSTVWHGWLMLAVSAVYLLLTLSLSQPIWESVPLIDFVQFPWRFVGRAALPVAFLAGLPFATFVAVRKGAEEQKSRGAGFSILQRSLLALFAITLLTVEALPYLYPNSCPEDPFPTIQNVHRYEAETGLVGVDPAGSYFPTTVQERPQTSPLVADYEAERTPQRFDITTTPPNAVLHEVRYESLGATIHLTTPEPFTAQYLTFAFPGWVAEVDGTAVPITPSNPAGLITFPVPAGEHTLTIAWRSTPLRTALVSASLLAFVAAIGVTFFLARNPLLKNKPQDKNPLAPFTGYRSLFAVALLLIGGKLLVDRVNTPLRRAAPPPIENQLVLQGGELRLEGFNLSRQQVPAGTVFDVDMAWTAVSFPQVDYQTNVWLEGPEGLIWSDKETYRPRMYEDAPRTRAWQPGQWAWDSREVQVFSGTPPGQYNLVLTLFDRSTLQPVTLLNERGEVVGPTAVLGQIEVVMPAEPPVFTPQYPLDVSLGNGLRLLGYNQDRQAAAPGESVLLTLFWQKEVTPVPDLLPLSLVDGAGTAVADWPIPLASTYFDLTQWRAGERLRGQHALRLPASLSSGAYQFVLDELPLGALQVNAPERVFEQPTVETAVDIPFTMPDGPQLATLTGYIVATAADQLTLTLVWQARTELSTSYRVFVHLVDESGDLIIQSDGEPANWTRPTTGWTVGEFITDPHQLTLPPDLPAGPLTLRIGLYDPATGQRLQTPSGDFAPVFLP